MRPRAGLVRGVILAMSLLASPVLAAERELDEDTSPSSASEIETPIERVFPEEEVREPLFPGLRQRLQTAAASSRRSECRSPSKAAACRRNVAWVRSATRCG